MKAIVTFHEAKERKNKGITSSANGQNDKDTPSIEALITGNKFVTEIKVLKK